MTKIQAAGFFTVVNRHPSAAITLVNGANVQTLNGQDLVLAPAQVAGFVVANAAGDVIRQVF